MLRAVLALLLFVPALAWATELPAPAEEKFQQDVAWSPDGQHLAFSEFSGGEYSPDKWAVWVVRTDGSDRRLIAHQATYVTWSPDGKRVAYGSGQGDHTALFATPIDSGATEQLTDLKHKDRQPAWSPDGSRLAFVSDRAGRSNLFVLKLADKSVAQVTDDSLKDYNPQWSPDGDRLVFYREVPDGHDDILVAAADGSEILPVTRDSALDIFPCFHPSGDVVFTTSATRQDSQRLVQMKVDGSDRHYLMEPTTFFARVSPDGKKIAFISGRWPKTALYILNIADSQIIKVIN